MIHLSQNSAFSRVVPSSARSSTPATPSSISAPAMPLTTYSAHASAMPIFFAMNAFPLTYPPAFLPTSGPMFSYSIPTFTFLPPTLPTAVLLVPPTTPVLPVASSSPASGTSSSSSSSAAVLPIPSSTASLPIASSSPVSSASSASSSSQSVKLNTKNLLLPKSIINHARNSLSTDKATRKEWTQLEERQLLDIQKDHERYRKEGTHWITVAAQTLKRSNMSVYRKFRRMQ